MPGKEQLWDRLHAWFYFNAMLLQFLLYDKSVYLQYKYRQEKLKFNSKIVKIKLRRKKDLSAL